MVRSPSLRSPAADGRLLSPAASSLSTRAIHRYLPYHSVSIGPHYTIGKLVRVTRERGKFYRRITLRYEKRPLRIDGCAICQPVPGSTRREQLTPRQALSRSLPSDSETSWRNTAAAEIISQIDTPFPAWKQQVENVLNRLGNGRGHGALSFELSLLWREWSSSAVGVYLSGGSSAKNRRRGSAALAAAAQPWRGRLPPLRDSLSDHLNMISTIRSEWFSVWRPQLLFDAAEFFASENARPAELLQKELRLFVNEAKELLTVKWPLRVGRILLEEATSWMDQLVRGAGEGKRLLDAVATTQTILLADVICENIQRINRHLHISENSYRASLLVTEDEGIGAVFKMEEIFLELCRIPRADSKIYPRLFGEGWIDASDWLRFRRRKSPPAIPLPFANVLKAVNDIENHLADWKKITEYNLAHYKDMMALLCECDRDASRVLPRARVVATLFDFSLMKKRVLGRIGKLKAAASSTILDQQRKKNDELDQMLDDSDSPAFTSVSTQLFGRDILEQLSKVSEVSVLLPKVEEAVSNAIEVYCTLLDYIELADADIRDAFDISRLGTKLRELADFVWRRVQHDRKWITKQVRDESESLELEAAMLEKELEGAIAKYRNSSSIAQVQRVALKLSNIAGRCASLHAKCKAIWVKLSLLGLDSICESVPSMSSQAALLAELARLHHQTAAAEEGCLRARIFDLSKDEVETTYTRLQAEFESFEAQIPEIERESALNIAGVAVNVIRVGLGKLQHLVPILTTISNRNMKEHHWKMAMATDGGSLAGNPVVSALLDMNILEKSEVFEEVGILAEKELLIELSIQSMRDELSPLRILPKAPPSEWPLLEGRLAGQAARCRTLLATLPRPELAEQLRKWMEVVEALGGYIHRYAKCVSSWRRVEGVFATDDIAYQMPTEFWTFTRIRQIWMQLNFTIAEKTLLERADEMESLSASLNELLALFAVVEAGFNSYLAKKRAAFPRLEMLSGGELLELLSLSREPTALVPFIPTLFARLKRFSINGRGEVVSVITFNGEEFYLEQRVNAEIHKHHAEKWLSELDKEIVRSFRNRMKSLAEEHRFNLGAVMEMNGVPEQIVELYALIASTHLIEKALKVGGLKRVLDYLEGIIKEVTSLVKTRPQLAHRLVVLLGQRQRTVRELVATEANHTDDEHWISELRFYWNNEHIFVRLYRSVFCFDYELLGSSRMPPSQCLLSQLDSGPPQNDFVLGYRLELLLKTAVRCAQDAMPLAIISEEADLKELGIQVARFLGRPLIQTRRDQMRVGLAHLCRALKNEVVLLSGLEPAHFLPFRITCLESFKKKRKKIFSAALLIGGVCILNEAEMAADTLEELLLALLGTHSQDPLLPDQLKARIDGSEVFVSRSAFFILRLSKSTQIPRTISMIEVSARVTKQTTVDYEQGIADLFRCYRVDESVKLASELCEAVSVSCELLSAKSPSQDPRQVSERAANYIVQMSNEWSDEKSMISTGVSQSMISTGLSQSLLPSLADQDRQVLGRLFAFSANVSSSIRRKLHALHSKEPPLHPNSPFALKCEQIYSLLSSRNDRIVVVEGAALTGKTTLLSMAKRMREAEGIAVSLSTFPSHPNHFEHQIRAQFKKALSDEDNVVVNDERWLVFDGRPTERILRFLESFITADFKTTFPTWIRVIIETDRIPRSTRLPVIHCDHNMISVAEKLLPDVLPHSSFLRGFGIPPSLRTLFTIRLQGLTDAISLPDTPDAQALLHLLVLLTLVKTQIIKKNFHILKSPFPFEDLLVRYTQDKIGKKQATLNSADEAKRPADFLKKLVLAILRRTAWMVFVCGERGTSQEHMIHALTLSLNKSFTLLEMSCGSACSVPQLEAAITACSSLRSPAEEGVSDEMSSLLLLHLHYPLKEERGELLRQLSISLRSLKIVVILRGVAVSSALSPRMERIALPISTDFTERETTKTAAFDFPLRVYSTLLAKFHDMKTEACAARELRRALATSQLGTSYRSVLAYLDEKASHAPAESTPLFVRNGHITQLSRLLEEYRKTCDELGLSDSLCFTPSLAAVACSLEMALFARSSAIIVENSFFKAESIVRVAAALSGFTHEKITLSTSAEEYEILIEKILRTVVLDNGRVVLTLTYIADSLIHQILEDMACLIMKRGLPARLCTSSLLCEISDKFTALGGGIWPEMRIRLEDGLVFLLSLQAAESLRFLQRHQELSSHCLLLWHSMDLDVECREVCRSILSDSCLFEKQIDGIVDTLSQVRQVLLERKVVKVNAKFANFVRTFCNLFKQNRGRVSLVMKRYTKGMEKLRQAEKQIGYLQGELLRLQPQLVRTSIETSMLMSSIERESIEVENAREVVAANEHKANEAATKAQALKVESEEDLANALPALEAAVDALETMRQSDISSLKTMRFPPYGVRICMEAVCILLGEQPAKITDPETGQPILDFWPTGQRLLSDLHFLHRIRTFQRDSIPRRTIALVRERYLSKEDFDPEKVKQSSLAAESLCLWVKAVDLYSRISGIVQPKKERLRKAEALVKQHMRQLDIKRRALQKVTEKLQTLSDQFSQMSQKKQELQTKIHSCEIRMERAERLVAALGGEKQKWTVKMESIKAEAEEVLFVALAQACAIEFLSMHSLADRKKVLGEVGVRVNAEKKNLFTSAVDNASLIRNTRKIVYIADTEDAVFEELSKSFNSILDVVDGESGDENVLEAIRKSASCGRVILIKVVVDEDRLLSSPAFQLKMPPEEGGSLLIHGVECSALPAFRVVLAGDRSLSPSLSASLDMSGVLLLEQTLSPADVSSRCRDVILRRNVADLVQRRDELIELIEQQTVQLAGLEENMLDLLARSQDLDDDRAIDLLSQSKQLAETRQRCMADLEAIMKWLGVLQSSLSSVFSRSSQLIGFARSLVVFSPFYNFSPKYLISIFDVELLEKLEDPAEISAEEARLTSRLTSLIWNELSPSLAPLHRRMFWRALQSTLNPDSRGSCEPEDAPSADFDFARLIMHRSAARIPLLLVIPCDSAGFLDILADLARGRIVRGILNRELPNLVSEKLSQSIWLVVSSAHLEERLSIFAAIIQQLNDAEIIDPCFRLILVASDQQPIRRWLPPTRSLFIRRPSSFSIFASSVIATPSISSTLSTLKGAQESQLVSLLALHFSLRLRSSFGVHGFQASYVFNEHQIHATLRLFKEVRTGITDRLNLERLRLCILLPIYASVMDNDYDLMVLETLSKWILGGGIGVREDDAVVVSFLREREDSVQRSHLLHSSLGSDSKDSALLTGLSPSFINATRQAMHQKVLEGYSFIVHGGKASEERRDETEPAIAAQEGEKMSPYPTWQPFPCVSNCLLNELHAAASDGDRKRARYLKSLLDGGDKAMKGVIDVSNLKRPAALLASLRAIAAETMNVPVVDVELHAGVCTTPADSSPSVLLSVFLLNAQLDSRGALREASAVASRRVTLRIWAGRIGVRPAPPTPSAGIPLVQPGQQKPLLLVPLQSEKPLAHWLLRGVRFLTVDPSTMHQPSLELLM